MNNPFEGLDVDKIKSAGLPTKLMLGGSVAFFIFAFLEWYSVESSIVFGGGSVGWNGMHSFFGILAWLLMIGVGVLAVLQLVKGQNQNFTLAALGASGASVLMVLIYWMSSAGEDIPDVAGLDSGASFGLFLSLIAALVATAGAFMTFQASQQSS